MPHWDSSQAEASTSAVVFEVTYAPCTLTSVTFFIKEAGSCVGGSLCLPNLTDKRTGAGWGGRVTFISFLVTFLGDPLDGAGDFYHNLSWMVLGSFHFGIEIVLDL